MSAAPTSVGRFHYARVLLVDADGLASNLATMTDALPGRRLCPHVKAHKCTELARRQSRGGHPAFCWATRREADGMVRAGLAEDLLVANEVADAGRSRPEAPFSEVGGRPGS